MQDEIVELDVGSIILAPGFEPFDPSKFDTYNYAKHPNVITSMEMERLLSASGPTGGHLVRMSDHKEPKKIAWFQCVGSRDMNHCDHSYCSSVCCMYAIKEAVIAKEHAGDGLECAIFYMDMRTHGKDFERFYNTAQDKHGVRFICSRVHSITPVGGGDDLEVRYVTRRRQPAGRDLRHGRALHRDGDLPGRDGNGQAHGHRAHRGALLQDRLLQPGGHLQAGGVRVRGLPGPQGHPAVGGRLQRGGDRGGRDPRLAPATP